MEFNLKRPCENCPFRADKPNQKQWLGRKRATEIATNVLQADKTFTCHKTLHKPQDKQSMCAGALQMLHNATKQDSPWGNSTIQIAERLGLYDPNQQDFESVPVFQGIEEMADFHSFEESKEEIYYRKTETIQAWQLTHQNVLDGVPDFIDIDIVVIHYYSNDPDKITQGAFIRNQGLATQCAHIGDWIVKKEDGLFYAIPDDVFHQKYYTNQIFKG